MTATMADSEFQRRLVRHARDVEQFLEGWFSSAAQGSTQSRQPPERLLAAIRHGLLNGGKRFRPFLVMECAALGEGAGEQVLHAAGALECVHSYSLVHDDLPAMDDDDLRRGKPTVHKAYDDATAILAGDALLTEAFSLIARSQLPHSLTIVDVLAEASGARGMVGGQMHDLLQEKTLADESAIIMTQAMKTGALIEASCRIGGLAGGLDDDHVTRLGRYGSVIGLAFQLSDDLLDATASSAVLGKTAGKDEKSGKRTLLNLHGEDWVRVRLGELVDEAAAHLDPFGARADVLIEAAHFVAWRES